MVAAFVADPVFTHLFGAHYPEQAAVFAGALFDLRVDLGTIWLVERGASLAMWSPPAPGGHTGVLGALDVPARTAERLAEYDHAVESLLPTSEHWYLGVLATHPASAGKGWGRVAMARGLASASKDGLPAYLETASDVNVGIYQRVGWKVAATARVGPLHVRVMSNPGS